MKKLTYLFAGFLLALTAASCGGGSDTDKSTDKDSTETTTDLPSSGDVKKRYGIESGIVEYEYSGSQTGKETLYFEEWGWKEVKYTDTEMKIMGMTQKNSTIAMINNDRIYNYDVINKKGTKMKNPLLDALTEEQLKDLAQVGMAMMKQMGAVKTGNENVAGKDCEVWEIKSLGGKVWIWNYIVLKMSTKMAGIEINMLATKVQEGGDIPSDKMKFADDIDPAGFTDLSDMLDKAKKD